MSVPTIERGAILSPCGAYRYSLYRRWDWRKPMVLFIMLNPSTADAERDDPTIRRCMAFARRWGAGGIRVCNLYAWRATRPADLKAAGSMAVAEASFAAENPNDSRILTASLDAGRIVAAWGAWPGPYGHRTHRVAELLKGRHVEALGLTKHGAPRHPLYVRGDVEPVTYWGSAPIEKEGSDAR